MSQFLPDFFLILLIIGYICMTVYDIVVQLRAQRLKRQLIQRKTAARPAIIGRRNRVQPKDPGAEDPVLAGAAAAAVDDDEAFELTTSKRTCLFDAFYCAFVLSHARLSLWTGQHTASQCLYDPRGVEMGWHGTVAAG